MTTKSEGERAALMAAMDRVLSGDTRYAEPGNLTQTALAQEARLHRSRLVNVHTDIRDLFEARKAAQSSISENERALREKIDQLTRTNRNLRAERDKWKSTATTFARVIQALQAASEAENRGENVTRIPRR